MGGVQSSLEETGLEGHQCLQTDTQNVYLASLSNRWASLSQRMPSLS